MRFLQKDSIRRMKQGIRTAKQEQGRRERTEQNGNSRQNEYRLSVKLLMMIFGFVAVLVVGIYFLSESRYSAATMRLRRIEGTVSLEEEGIVRTILRNMKLHDGNALKTDLKSLASISLDDTKLVTLEELSRAEFYQKRKELELKLTDGRLFFDVSKKLENDETFDIRTSTMVVGIRGTTGYVCVDEEGHDGIFLLDGKVHLTGINPVTKEIKEIDVEAGERAWTYLYYDREKDTVTFEKEELAEEDIPVSVVVKLVQDEELLDKVCEETGWDKEKLLDIAEEANEEDIYGDSELSVFHYRNSEAVRRWEIGDESAAETEAVADQAPVSGTPTPAVTLMLTPSPTPEPASSNGEGTSLVSSSETGAVAAPTAAPAPAAAPAPTSAPGSSRSGTATPSPALSSTPSPTPSPASSAGTGSDSGSGNTGSDAVAGPTTTPSSSGTASGNSTESAKTGTVTPTPAPSDDEEETVSSDTASVKLAAVSDDGKALAGAKVRFFSATPKSSRQDAGIAYGGHVYYEYGTYTSDSRGMIRITRLPFDEYLYIEESAPAGFYTDAQAKSGNYHYTFTLIRSDAGKTKNLGNIRYHAD